MPSEGGGSYAETIAYPASATRRVAGGCARDSACAGRRHPGRRGTEFGLREPQSRVGSGGHGRPRRSRSRTPGAFVDRKLLRGFAPFGIQAVGSRIFVTFAKQDAKGEDDVHGPGLGFVDAFDRNGKLLARVARRGELNAPWGIARAPRTFGRFGGDLLIGNFGDGRINAFRQRPGGTFAPAGELRTAAGRRLVIDGLWALQFGHGTANNGPANTLFFTAGPDDEAHGLFGTITAG